MSTFQLSLTSNARTFLWVQLAIHLFAVYAILLLSVNGVVKGVAILFLLLHGTWQIIRYHRTPSLTALGCQEAGWFVVQAAEKRAIQILGDSVLTRWVISIHGQYEGTRKRFYLWIFVWQYSPDDYRAIARLLRVK